MARKPKRMALYEAIRQGQMKIADGLKNGQMRSDGLGQANQKVRPVDYKSPDAGKVLLRSEEKAPKRVAGPSKMTMVIMGIAAQVLILGLGIWLGILFMGSDEEQVAQQSPEVQNSENEAMAAGPTEETEETESRTGFFWNRKKAAEEADESDSDEPEVAKEAHPAKEEPAPAREMLSSGDNVIAIQSISPNRRSELKPLIDYFATKGIETTVIFDRASGYDVLVTKAGFKRNPGVRGTDGYALYNRIKQLGLSFVEETGITDFTARPFQDIYGYKIE